VDALGRQVGDGVIEQMADDARRRYLRGLGRVTTFRPFEELAGLGIAIVGDPGQVDGFAALFREELEVEPSMVVTKCTEMPQQTEADSGIATCVSDYTVLKEMLRDEKPDVLLGSDIDLLLCGSTKPRVYLSIGYPGGNIVRFSPRPYWGFQGCLNFTEDLLNQLSQTRNR
jgi:nitrogenase molybdenum-iron protein alpha/beta subunit